MQTSFLDAVERCRRGDPAAFGAVVEALASPLVRFVSGLLGGDVDGAHDVAQEALIAAWRRLPRLTDPATLRAWVFQVAYHRAMSWMRRRGPGGARFQGLDDEPLVPEPGPGPTWKVLGERVTGEEMAPRLRSVLASLPARYGAPLILHHLEGLPARTCAEALGLSIGTLKMRLLRARTLLRRRFLARERFDRDHRDAAERAGSASSAPGPARGPVPEERAATSRRPRDARGEPAGRRTSAGRGRRRDAGNPGREPGAPRRDPSGAHREPPSPRRVRSGADRGPAAALASPVVPVPVARPAS